MKIVMRDVTLIRQFQQAFFAWLAINQSRFVTPPFEMVNEGCRIVRFTMPGLHRAFVFSLHARGISMGYEWQGIHWTLKMFEAFPIATDGGYLDGLCLDDDCLILYPSCELLWTECVFEPFLAWVNCELTPPSWLARHPLARPLTKAHFINHPDTSWRVILPIWTNQNG
ncbi:hypothetical protein ACQE3E_17755 [Methylomonas sp. MED-D]|uniref:hypothetical protein n=1 Tax=Methylomonas sp. MED-D TaxID=3418768 RepID=UPI003D00CC99